LESLYGLVEREGEVEDPARVDRAAPDELDQLSVTDAMGYDVDAALLATLLVGALRRARRAGAEQARQADRAMREHGRGSYVTGQLLRISLVDGRAEFVNAGHPWPLRMRDGEMREIAPKVDMPFGFTALTAIGSRRWTCVRATGW
jgi:serine phosphatase RsbU (regulator of sigma subunit)